MNGSALDTVVVVVFALQILAVVGVAVALVRLRDTGQRAGRRVGVVVKAGVGVAETGQKVAPALAARAAAVARSARAVRQSAHFPEPPEGFLVTPQSLIRGYGYYRGARTVLATLRRQPARTGPARRTVADRLGLVPPIARRLGWLWTGGRVALKAYRAARKPH